MLNYNSLKIKIFPIFSFVYTLWFISWLTLDLKRYSAPYIPILRSLPIIIGSFILAYYFYKFSQTPPLFIYGKNSFIKIFFYNVSFYITLILPIAWVDSKDSWLSGIITILCLIVLLPLGLIMTLVSYFLDKPEASQIRQLFHLFLEVSAGAVLVFAAISLIYSI